MYEYNMNPHFLISVTVNSDNSTVIYLYENIWTFKNIKRLEKTLVGLKSIGVQRSSIDSVVNRNSFIFLKSNYKFFAAFFLNKNKALICSSLFLVYIFLAIKCKHCSVRFIKYILCYLGLCLRVNKKNCILIWTRPNMNRRKRW